MILEVVFIVFFILCALGAFAPDATYPWAARGRYGVLLLLVGILGWVVFGGHR